VGADDDELRRAPAPDDPEGIAKLASNENPRGVPPVAREAAQKALQDCWLYPDNDGYELSWALAAHFDLDPAQFTLAAGSNEIFYLLCALFVEPGVEVVMGEHAFISYLLGTIRSGGTPVRVPMPEGRHNLDALAAAITPQTRLIFLPNPNNPTGTVLPRTEVEAFAANLPDHVVFCYDEAYAEYLDDPPDLRPLIAAGRKIVVTRTFSKIYALAGLRLGYGYSEPTLAKLLNVVRPPFNTTHVAQAAALAALQDVSWVIDSRAENASERTRLTTALEARGYTVMPSAANFVLVEVGDGARMASALQTHGIITRPVAGYGLPRHLRVSVGRPAQNDQFLEALDRVRATPSAVDCS